ncbi:MAG: TonB-dependent receptor [Gelidibacter sp.]
MKKLLLLLTLIGSFAVNAQDTGSISGLITDAKGMPLSGATVSIRSLNKGAMTDFDGRYAIESIAVGNYNVAISYIGYETSTKSVSVVAGQTTSLEASLKDSDTVLDEVILTANKKPQKITDVPATVNVITARDIQEFPSFNIGELAARQKGVDFVRTGVLGTGINIRGFNSAFNSKNLQVTDDRLSSLIATGLPMGSFTTISKDDIERVEILLGPNGTLYGPNAHNGLVSTITKNPRTSEGTTFAIGAGNQNVFTGRVRHAQVIDDKFAYKVHFERAQGTEFDYVDSVYVGTKGYKELDLDRDFSSQKYGATLNYKPTEASELTGYYGHSNSSNIGVTSAGRNQIKDWRITEAQLKFVSKNFFANTYYTWSKTDDTYAMNQRTQNYVSFIDGGYSDQEARERSFNEQWFAFGPGIGNGIALERGALFVDDSRRFNAEAQYNNNWDDFYLTLGAQYQKDMADSKGTYLLDDGGINLGQTGVYTQLEYKLEDTGWGFLAGGRLDNHDLYGSNFIPKLAITKKVNNGTFRITYGKGMAVPSILNLKGKLFGGVVLGNGEGFTLANGTMVPKLDVETINSYEIGYKGKLSDKLFIDTNAYYNVSDNFIGPLVNVAASSPVTHVGSTPIGELVPGLDGGLILSYLNFGHVDTYGFDAGFNYYFNDSFRGVFNYSYFGRTLDLDDMANDGNLDGVVLESELPINTPNNKFSLGLHYNKGKFYAAAYGRYVQKYDFFSGINVAAKTQDQNGDGVNDIVENSRVGRTWNYGQLGGFTVDANAGYYFNDNLSLGVNITNLFNAEIREFVASPAISTLISFELKYNINFFKK